MMKEIVVTKRWKKLANFCEFTGLVVPLDQGAGRIISKLKAGEIWIRWEPISENERFNASP
ncbi:hypothetical protein AMK68_00220 [candidate division KD3-62 bacterium DG_56]|uniref:Uncharacterized protein n=1 Tax=candidate division KD3-62 bacterium DG_56 TaxID=1704032 RepID=A0A0S7XQW2_9BACT|nr:MAG: hypothetical protein AMK68_00220 [candidate division KD3-62 bacterium DG_56]